MTVVSALTLAIAAFGALVLVLSAWSRGRDADLLDWDPRDRIRARRNADLDELACGLDEHNRRRRITGLPPQTEDELRRELAQRRRRAGF